MRALRVAFSVMLALIGASSLATGFALRWADSKVFDTAEVSETSTEMFRDPDVQALLSREITEKVMEFVVDETQRGTVTNLVTQIVADQRALVLIDQGVREAHQTLVDTENPAIRLNLQQLAVEVRKSLVNVSPALEATLPPAETWFDFQLFTRDDLPKPYEWLDRFHGSAFPLMLFGGCLIALAIVLGPARWAMLMTAGLGVAAFGLAISFGLRQALRAAEDRVNDPLALTAAKDVFSLLFDDLNRQAITLTVTGAIAALLGISIGLIRPEYMREKDPWAPQQRRRSHR
jgi:hypothetical protein